jgi:Rnl2 family RNA ligase
MEQLNQQLNQLFNPRFKQYASIEPLNEKHIRELSSTGWIESKNWIALEKIHGANFSFITDGTTVRTAKRSGFIQNEYIKPDGSKHPGEYFYHHNLIEDKYREDILQLYELIENSGMVAPERLIQIQVFGEFFGGSYPGFTDKTPIQKGVHYCPEADFLVFDIRVDFIYSFASVCKDHDRETISQTDIRYNSEYLPHSQVEQFISQLPKLRTVPIVKRGSFDELITLDPVFQTRIPDLYGLEPIEGNMAEGYVFKQDGPHSAHHSRPLIKSKNSTFAEVLKNKPKIKVSVDSYDITDILPYCTQNRFNNTISKIGLDNRFEKMMGLFVTDALKDYEKDLPDEEKEYFEKNSKKIKSTVIGYLHREGCVRDWLNGLCCPSADTNVE